ncbi:MAG: septum site-determining protein MinC [Prochlorococcaceae cyanobacterium]
MAALLIAGREGSGPHRLRLPLKLDSEASALDAVRYSLGETPPQGELLLEAGHWPLTVPQLRAILELLASRGLSLEGVESSCPTTLVAASSLKLGTYPKAHGPSAAGVNLAVNAGVDEGVEEGVAAAAGGQPPLTIHRGPLRSGEHLQVEGSVLLLGDVNPGARISAGGHVLVWGRLRGIAHAGCQGNRQARIVALQLRPLQLRIADVVARGPAAVPPPGLSEEAQLSGETIQIDPARPIWPASD